MKKNFLSFLLYCFATAYGFSQQTSIRGFVKDMVTAQPVDAATVKLEGINLSTLTDENGSFEFLLGLPNGEQLLIITKENYFVGKYKIVLEEGKTLDLPNLEIEFDDSDDELFTITLSDDELNNDTSGADNISGLLSASMDIFQRTAAFEFNQSFFRMRGLNTCLLYTSDAADE